MGALHRASRRANKHTSDGNARIRLNFILSRKANQSHSAGKKGGEEKGREKPPFHSRKLMIDSTKGSRGVTLDNKGKSGETMG